MEFIFSNPWLGPREDKGNIQGEAGALLQDSSSPHLLPTTWEGFLCEAREGDPSTYTKNGPRIS